MQHYLKTCPLFIALFILSVYNYAVSARQGHKDLGGPLGADATAFYIDEQQNYWLGTGSSGGVYLSMDQGSSWEVMNEGLGTLHISWLGKIEGQVYAEAFENDLAIANITPPFNFYQWDEEGKSWLRIADRNRNEQLMAIAQQEVQARWDSITRHYPLTFGNSSIKKEAIINSNDASFDDPSYYRITGFTEAVPQATLLNESFPKDAYHLRGGNFYESKYGELFVLSRSGVYKLKDQEFRALGKVNLRAADVTHLSPAPQGGFYALANRQDLSYRGTDGTWSTLYSASTQPSAGLLIEYAQRINTHPNTRTLLCLQGDIWEIIHTLKPKLQKLVPAIEWEEEAQLSPYKLQLGLEESAYSEGINMRFLSAAMDTDSTILAIALAEIKAWETHIPMDAYLMRFKLNSKEYSIEKIEGLNRYSTLATNPYNGEIWLIGNGHPAMQLSTAHPPYQSKRLQIGMMQENNIAFLPNGNIATYLQYGPYGYTGSLNIWKAQKQQTEIYHTALRDSIYIEALAFNDKGELYGGTGYQFLPPGYCGSYIEGKASGIYTFTGKNWQAVNTQHPNPWILSLSYTKEDGLLVGTSGSSAYAFQRNTAANKERATGIITEYQGKLGIKSDDGQWLIEAKYERIDPLSQGYFQATESNSDRESILIRIDAEGKVYQTEEKWANFKPLNHNYFLAGLYTDRTALLAPNLSEVIEPRKYEFHHYAQALWLKGEGEHYFFKDNGNSWEIAYRAENISGFADGLIVKTPEGYRIIDVNGNLLLEEPFEYAFSHGKLLALQKKGKIGVWSVSKNDWLLPAKYTLDNTEEDLYFLKLHKKKNSLAIYNRYDDGEPLQVFAQAIPQDNRLYHLQNEEGKWGIALAGRKQGLEWRLPATYDQLSVNADSTQLYVYKAGKAGLYDLKKRELIVPARFAEVKEEDVSGHYKVRVGTGWGTFNIYSESKSLPTTWEDVRSFAEYELDAQSKKRRYSRDNRNWKSNNQYGHLFMVKKGGKWGLFDDLSGKLILGCQYEELHSRMAEKGFAVSVKGNRSGLIEMQQFTEVLPATMQEIAPFYDGKLLVKQRGKYGILDMATNKLEDIPSIFKEFEQGWTIPGEVMSPSASIRVSNGHVWLPMPLRRRITRYDVARGREANLIEPGKLNRLGQLALDGNRAFFTDGYRTLFCYRDSGEKVWEFTAQDTIYLAPIIGNFGANGEKQVAMVDALGEIIALDWATGSVKWKSEKNWTHEVKGHIAVVASADGQRQELLTHHIEQVGLNQEFGYSDCRWNTYLERYSSQNTSPTKKLLMGCDHQPSALIPLSNGSGEDALSVSNQSLYLLGNGMIRIEPQLEYLAEHEIRQLQFDLASGTAYHLQQALRNEDFTFIQAQTFPQPLGEDGGTMDEGFNEFGEETPVEAFESEVHRYHIGEVTAPPFIADILGKGSPQVGWVSEEGILLLLEGNGKIAGLYRLPRGVKAMPWVGDADGDGNLDLLVADTVGSLLFLKGKKPGKVYWGEWQGNSYNQGRGTNK